MGEARGFHGDVGWVERSDTHQFEINTNTVGLPPTVLLLKLKKSFMLRQAQHERHIR